MTILLMLLQIMMNDGDNIDDNDGDGGDEDDDYGFDDDDFCCCSL